MRNYAFNVLLLQPLTKLTLYEHLTEFAPCGTNTDRSFCHAACIWQWPARINATLRSQTFAHALPEASSSGCADSPTRSRRATFRRTMMKYRRRLASQNDDAGRCSDDSLMGKQSSSAGWRRKQRCRHSCVHCALYNFLGGPTGGECWADFDRLYRWHLRSPA